ncbi:hypothetical protein SAMN05216312_111191 [Cohnella sp. OV330]|nr:hypothetical protein SAMN05216312_111191 [Cohnella sp. OV330]
MYAAANKSYNIEWGLTSIRLTVGRNTETANGNEIMLSKAVSVNKGEAFFTADFLTKKHGAGTLVVGSADTPL